MRVEYTLDQWEWQGTTRSIEVAPEDYQGMTIDEIKKAVYVKIRRDAEQNLHLVYAKDEVAREIHEGAQNEVNDEDESETIELDDAQKTDLRARFEAMKAGR